MKKINLHNSIESIPIIQCYKLFDTLDLRYLLFLTKAEIFNLPKIKITKDFEDAYDKLFLTLTNIDNTEQLLIINMLKSNISNGSKNNIDFNNYLIYLEKNFTNFKFKDENIADIRIYYEEMKKKYAGIDLKNARVFFLINLEKESRIKTDIYKNLITLKKNGYDLDKFENTWQDYMTSMEMFNKDVKKNTKENTKH